MGKGINGRTKGHTFERKMAKVFSEWSGTELRRTPMSGGWQKTGDITAVKPEDLVIWPLNIECKSYAKDTFHLEDLLKKKNGGPIVKWWKQCIKDADISNRMPLLVFTQNRDIVYVMGYYEDFKLRVPTTEYLKYYIPYDEDEVVIMTLDTFLESLDIDHLKTEWFGNVK